MKTYRNYNKDVDTKLPFTLKILVQRINLHDGKLEIVYFDSHKKNLILRGVFGDLQLGYSFLELKHLNISNLDLSKLTSSFKHEEIEILSNEIEVLTPKLFSHRILFSTHKNINIKFEGIELKTQNASHKNYIVNLKPYKDSFF